MKRREFLIGAAAAAGLTRTNTWARTRQQPKGDAAKLSRVAIMSLSFNSILKNPSQPDNPAKTLDIMDLGQMYADRYGVHNVEMQHAHFPSTELSYLKSFREGLARTKSQVTNINLEFGPQNISAADPALRQQAVDRTKEWIDHAVALGCPRIMVNQGQPTPENKEVAIAALKAMGVKSTVLAGMVLLQSSVVGAIGFGFGAAMCVSFFFFTRSGGIYLLNTGQRLSRISRRLITCV